MNKLLLLAAAFLTLIFAAQSSDHSAKVAEKCDPEICKLPSCRCSLIDTPGDIPTSEIPQLVFFTFDDAVTPLNFPYYEEAFFDKTNPDGCPVGVTFFVAHEYADYSKVHELYARGHEIALHSISHKVDLNYWSSITPDDLIAEFAGEKEIISHFANMSIDSIQGVRLPFLQMSGDTSFGGMKEIGLTYDSSWPSLQYQTPALWPYTLDYKSVQDCPIGPCPTESHPGIWVSPMTDWSDDNGNACAMVDSCSAIPADAEGQFQFMLRNFNRQYEGSRAPVGVYLHASWFALSSIHYDAYKMFVNYVNSLNDVYIVTLQRGLEWVKNPQPISKLKETWPTCQHTQEIECSKVTCELKKGEEVRYMTHCAGECPTNYPWIGNPLGQ